MLLRSSSVGEHSSLRLLRLLLPDLGDFPNLSKEVGEDVLGCCSDVDAVVGEVFPARWDEKSDGGGGESKRRVESSQKTIEKRWEIADELQFGYRIQDGDPTRKMKPRMGRNDVDPLLQQRDEAFEGEEDGVVS